MGIDADAPNPVLGPQRVGSTIVMSRSIFMPMCDADGEITKGDTGVSGELIVLIPPLTLVCGELPLVVAEIWLCEPFPTGYWG